MKQRQDTRQHLSHIAIIHLMCFFLTTPQLSISAVFKGISSKYCSELFVEQLLAEHLSTQQENQVLPLRPAVVWKTTWGVKIG